MILLVHKMVILSSLPHLVLELLGLKLLVLGMNDVLEFLELSLEHFAICGCDSTRFLGTELEDRSASSLLADPETLTHDLGNMLVYFDDLGHSVMVARQTALNAFLS